MTDAPDTGIAAWVHAHGAQLDARTLAPRSGRDAARIEAVLDALARARIVVLGELDHFVAERNHFRLWWLERLAQRRPLVLAEELGHADAKRITHYLGSGDAGWLEHVPTFGWRGDAREDRVDAPSGILKAAADSFPTARFKAAHLDFLRGLRTLGITRLHGIDVDGATGAAYADVAARLPALPVALANDIAQALARVPGETMAAEAQRLDALRATLPPAAGAHAAVLDEITFDIEWTAQTLRYAALAYPAADYEALRPAMAHREAMMKRAVGRLLARTPPGAQLVLLAHAFHLAKDDDRLGGTPGSVGPGGDIAHSLGHHLARERGEDVRAVWFAFAEGSDCQPFPGLPTVFDFPQDTLNARLAPLADALVLPIAPAAHSALAQTARIGHLYNLVAEVDLPAQADVLFFLRHVRPLGVSRQSSMAW